MEEVIGSIPIRSTNYPFIYSYLTAPPNSLLGVRGCGMVLNLQHFQRKHQFHHSQTRLPLLLRDRAGVNVEGRATAKMPDQLLSDLNVDTKRSQVRRERVTKAVPADLFPDDSDPRQRRTNALLEDAVRTEGLGSFEAI